MGISWTVNEYSQETQQQEVPEIKELPTSSAEGLKILAMIVNSYHYAEGIEDATTRTITIDALNEKFRSRAFRTRVSELRADGQITDNDFREMMNRVTSKRYAMRYPQAKAFRYQWP